MKKILIINGPNLNLLGTREPSLYGTVSFEEHLAHLKAAYPEITIDYYQTNHEGCIIDKLQEAVHEYDGVVMNPGAYAHTSIAIADCIRAIPLPVVEVHLTDIQQREAYRHHSFTAAACRACITGKGLQSYDLGLEELMRIQL